MAMTVKTTQRVVLCPLQAWPPDHCKMVPLTAFDRAPTDAYIPVVSAWKAPTPDNGTLIDGLLSTVARYPHLLGRIKADDHGRMCFHLNNAGMLIIEATADVDIADALAHCTPTHVNELYPKANTEFPEDEPLFQVQLTRYKCGGLVIGTVSQHQVADGHSMSSFFAAWATAVRTGSSILPTPFTDRTSTAVPRSPPSPSFNHRGIEFWREKNDGSSATQSHAVIPVERITNFSVHFPGEFVAELKALAATAAGGVQCSTFQCLLAHVWKKATAARGVPPGEATQVRVAVNCRSRASPPVGMDFFGNMVLWAFPRMRAGDLLSSSYAAVVGVIRDAVARVDAGYVQSFVDFVELADVGGEKLVSTAATVPGTAYCPDLEVDSWLGFRFSDLDFGCGPSCAFLQAETPVDGLMYFVRSSMGKDGVELFLALNDEHVDGFKKICYSLD